MDFGSLGIFVALSIFIVCQKKEKLVPTPVMTTFHVDMFTKQSQVFNTVAYTIYYRGPITSPTHPITLTTRIVKRALANVVR